MIVKRLNNLENLLNSSYILKLDKNNVHGVAVINKKTGRQCIPHINKKYFVICLYDSRKMYEYSVKELKLYAEGVDLEGRRVSDFKKEEAFICKICNLDYPKNEMINDTCYLCKWIKNKNSEGFKMKNFFFIMTIGIVVLVVFCILKHYINSLIAVIPLILYIIYCNKKGVFKY